MANIHIRHAHPLSDAKARKAVDSLATKLSQQFGLTTQWEGETLHFSRSGLEGSIALLPGEVELNAKLGLLFSPMKSTVETEIRRVLEDKF